MPKDFGGHERAPPKIRTTCALLPRDPLPSFSALFTIRASRHGSGMEPRLRRRISVDFRFLTGIGALLGVVLGVGTLAAPLRASATSPTVDPVSQASSPTGYYLALGDSLAFGYQDTRFKAEITAGTYNPADFNTGYVDGFFAMLKGGKAGVELVNYACPGETSSSFASGGCIFHQQVPLHNNYPAAQSQLAAATAFLQSHPGSVGPITLNIGGNDVGNLFFDTCNQDLACAQRQLPAVIGKAGTNLNQILSALQAASPASEIIVLTQYDPYVAAMPESVPAFEALNSTVGDVARAHGVRVADGSSPFTSATICSLTLFCISGHQDIHPSDAGYQALAQAVWSSSSFRAAAAPVATPASMGAPAAPNTGSGLMRNTSRQPSSIAGVIVLFLACGLGVALQRR